MSIQYLSHSSRARFLSPVLAHPRIFHFFRAGSSHYNFFRFFPFLIFDGKRKIEEVQSLVTADKIAQQTVDTSMMEPLNALFNRRDARTQKWNTCIQCRPNVIRL